MMDKLFLKILNMSIISSYVILFIILIRLFLKKLPKIFSYGLWSVAFLRLIFPFSFESIYSLISINSKTIPNDIIYKTTPEINSGIKAVDTVINRVLPPALNMEASVNPIQIWIGIGALIWIAGILLLVIYSIISTLKISKKLKSAGLLYDNIYNSKNIETSFVFGLFRPKIYLPINLSEDEKSYIIKHEETHIKRKDHIVKFIAFMITYIHWFNPLVWLAFYLMGEDMELSCDESVIKEMGYEIKKDYSASLLSLSIGRKIIGGSPIAFGENNTKGRIKNVLNYRKPKTWIIGLALILTIILSLGLLSNQPEKMETVIEDELDDKWSYKYRMEIDGNLITDEHIEINKKDFKIVFAEDLNEKLSDSRLLDDKEMLSGDRQDHIKIIGVQPTNISWTDGTIVTALIYEFENVPDNTNLKLELTNELRKKLGLEKTTINIQTNYNKNQGTSELVIEIGNSNKFDKKEIEDAVNLVRDNFSFPASTLTKIWYSEEESDKFTKFYLENGKGSVNGSKSENVIVLLSNFDVDDSGDNPVLNPGSTYENYNWILIRDNKNSEWTIDDSGY